ncbi:auxin-responsive protein IAA7-like [Rutidosis leptorrhynchoides]|uniref:auxin-responsive protein IAA7-like n=1 Tax=Rutidosis leptorrhynchoides TaxID=125765 RepID=UPI003A9A1948
MEGYPKSKKAVFKEAYEETGLELRLCPPGDGTNYPPMFKSSHKRAAQTTAVVGWPPVRASRKNIKTSSSSIKEEINNKKTDFFDNENSSLYVKINMDGVAIGRKVDLKAYDNYQRLSSAVDELFRGLLAAQGDVSVTTGLLDGNGEYTLVYEDNEGDRILVGDVPWDMFISSAKRLRVLKTSDLPVLRRHNK